MDHSTRRSDPQLQSRRAAGDQPARRSHLRLRLGTHDRRARMERPMSMPHHLVNLLRVTGGFLGGVELEFVDGLNCLIGGRGAGKTTALELIRFGLGLMPDPKVHGQRHKYIDGLVKGNLGSGAITVALTTKDGMAYTASRRASEEVLVANELGQAVPVSVSNNVLFGADVFSQNEIEDIALDPTAQLELIDRFEAVDTLAIRRELEARSRELEQSAEALTRIDSEISELTAKASELPALQERLKAMAEVAGPDAEKVNQAHKDRAARQNEERVPHELQDAVSKVVTEMQRARTSFGATRDARMTSALEDGLNGEVFRAIGADLHAVSSAVDAAVASVAQAGERFSEALSSHRASLAARHVQQEAAYRALVSTSEEMGGRSAERAKLQEAVTAAQAHATARDAKLAERAEAVAARQKLLNEMSELRDRRFALRKQVAAQITSKLPAIRVTVSQGEDLERYQQFLTEMLKGSGVQQGPTAKQLVQRLLPTELARVVANDDLSALVEQGGLPEDRARKVLAALRAPGVVYQIEAIDLHDQPCIELLDGERYKKSPHLSTGQRCTTILPILLLQSERPLLIDQPEDNLDNAFVYETVVKALQQVKGSRQVIFVTHNPNIPVLGRADRVFVFASDGEKGSVVRSGTVDDCKDDIERILEGGREAFEERYRRYGH